jgi:hypothetical protein
MTAFDLWLPTILSATALFFASAVAWMFLPHHRGDWTKLPDEDSLMKWFDSQGLRPGNYMFPHAGTPDEMKSEAFQERMRKGPRGVLCLWSTVPQMGRNMTWTFVFYFVSSFVIAYLSAMAMLPGESFWQVFRFVSTAGLLTYCAAGIPGAIWFHQKIATNLIDGVAYALISGYIFATCWP